MTYVYQNEPQPAGDWDQAYHSLAINKNKVSFIIQALLFFASIFVTIILYKRDKEERHSFVFLQLTL